MNDSRQRPIYARPNGSTAPPKPAAPAKPLAKPAVPTPAAKKESPKQDVLLRLWAEEGRRVVVHFVDGSELAGKVLQVEQYGFSLLTDDGPAAVHKVAVAWTRAK